MKSCYINGKKVSVGDVVKMKPVHEIPEYEANVHPAMVEEMELGCGKLATVKSIAIGGYNEDDGQTYFIIEPEFFHDNDMLGKMWDFSSGMFELYEPSDKMIEVRGKLYSESTLQLALENYINE